MFLPSKELPVTEAPKRKRQRRRKLSWEELDKCRSAKAIADLLAEHGIKGEPGTSDYCPLARATGWTVNGSMACIYSPMHQDGTYDIQAAHPLTRAEQTFIDRFDEEKYPELIR